MNYDVLQIYLIHVCKNTAIAASLKVGRHPKNPSFTMKYILIVPLLVTLALPLQANAVTLTQDQMNQLSLAFTGLSGVLTTSVQLFNAESVRLDQDYRTLQDLNAEASLLLTRSYQTPEERAAGVVAIQSLRTRLENVSRDILAIQRARTQRSQVLGQITITLRNLGTLIAQ